MLPRGSDLIELQNVPMGGTSSASGSLWRDQFPQGMSRQTPEGKHILEVTLDEEPSEPTQPLPETQRRFSPSSWRSPASHQLVKRVLAKPVHSAAGLSLPRPLP